MITTIMTTLVCSRCKCVKATTQFSKLNTKRGYHYSCKECVNDARRNKQVANTLITLQQDNDNTMITTQRHDDNTMITPIQHNDNTMITPIRESTNNKDVVMIVMDCALRHTVSFDSFMEVVKEFMRHTPLDIVCDIAFKQCRASYPDHYTELIRVFLQAPQQDQQEDEHEQEDEAEEEKPNMNTLSTSQQYIEQYKNDPNMFQVGDDVESDDEHSTMTIRSDDKYVKVRVKRQT